MANINTYSSASVSFTDDEKEILQKAHDLLKETGNELYEKCWSTNELGEDLAYEIGEIAEGIERAINGKYHCLK